MVVILLFYGEHLMSFDKLRTKLELARVQYPNDAAFKNRATEILDASMKGARVYSSMDKARFIVKWTYKVDEMIDMLHDIAHF